MLEDLKQECESKRASIVRGSLEFDEKLAKQEAACERLVALESKRANSAEKAAMDVRQDLADERKLIGELTMRIGKMEKEKVKMEEGRRMVVDVEDFYTKKVKVLEELAEELRQANRDLIERAKTLRERYSMNNLVGPHFYFLSCNETFRLDRLTKKRISLIGWSSYRTPYTSTRMLRERTSFAGFFPILYHRSPD
jgi:hypothetical protein